MREKYETLIERLQKACEILGWEFSLDTNLVDRAGVDDAVAFTIDKIEYMASMTDDGSERFIASFMVVNHSYHRDEPPSEDESVINGDGRDIDCPENLLRRFLDAHWQIRFQWVMESFISDAEGQEEA